MGYGCLEVTLASSALFFLPGAVCRISPSSASESSLYGFGKNVGDSSEVISVLRMSSKIFLILMRDFSFIGSGCLLSAIHLDSRGCLIFPRFFFTGLSSHWLVSHEESRLVVFLVQFKLILALSPLCSQCKLHLVLTSAFQTTAPLSGSLSTGGF
uniref:Uncharacterized protein n=1 Tax=Cannabis sativa TaxID=3483 RepID=A0A803Q3Q3_CANSA